MLCANSSTKSKISHVSHDVTLIHVPIWMVSQFIILCIIFSGKAWFRPIYKGINSICQGEGSPSIYWNPGTVRDLVQSFLVYTGFTCLHTHNQDQTADNIYHCYNFFNVGSTISVPWISFRNLSIVTFVLNISQGKPLLYNVVHLMR